MYFHCTSLGYNYATFGSIGRTGYSYWVPYWYARLTDTFSLSYLAPHSRAGEESNIAYYGHILFRTDMVLPTALTILALGGILASIVRLHHYTYSQAVVLVFLFLALSFYFVSYLLYFFRSERFFIPVLPILGVCTAIGVSSCVTSFGQQYRHPYRIMQIALLVTVVIMLVAGLLQAFRVVFQQSYFYKEHVLSLNQRYGIRYDVDRIIAMRCSSRCIVVTPDSPVYTEYVIPNARIINPIDNAYANNYNGQTSNALSLDEKKQLLAEALRDGIPIFYDLRVSYGKSTLYYVMRQLGQERQVASSGYITIFQLVRSETPPGTPAPAVSVPGIRLTADHASAPRHRSRHQATEW